MRPRAVLFDFNGTLSDDEPVLQAIYAELFAQRGVELTPAAYLDRLAGLSDEEIFVRGLGGRPADLEGLVAERIARYRRRVADGSSIGATVREAVRHAAARVSLGIVSGAAREEIEPVVAAAGLRDAFAFVVGSEDVTAGKPDPEGYVRALERLALPADQVLVFEDTEAGVAAARAAGTRVVAVTRTLGPARLGAADELCEAITPEVVRRLVP